MLVGFLPTAFSLIKSPPSPLKSYEAIFITYGCFTVLWGFFVLYWLPGKLDIHIPYMAYLKSSTLFTDTLVDSPMRAKCFSEEDKKLMIERVRSNQTGLQNKIFRSYQIKEALLDPQIWCYCLIQICTTLPTSGLGSFSQIVISGFHFSILQTQLLAMVLGAVIIITLLTSTWLVKKTHQNLLVMGFYVIP